MNTPLDQEIDKLTAELRTDARYVRLQQLKHMRDEYLKLPSIPAASSQSSNVGNGQRQPPRLPGRQRSPERERAIQETKKLLFGKTSPTRLAAISDHLEQLEIRLGGNDQLNNLSALLSTCGQFLAHGRSGWTLMEENKSSGQRIATSGP
jgi:hypothetical protein